MGPVLQDMMWSASKSPKGVLGRLSVVLSPDEVRDSSATEVKEETKGSEPGVSTKNRGSVVISWTRVLK